MANPRTAEYMPAERDDTTVIDFFTTNESGDVTDADQKAAELSAAMSSERTPYVTIHRIMGAGNMPEEYCTRLPADKFDFGQIQEYIANNFGAGDYRVRLYSSNKLVKGGNKLIQIASRINTAPTSVSPAGEASNIIAVVLQEIKESNRQMMQLMAQKNAAPDRMAFFQELMMMKELFAGNASSGGIGELKGTIELLAGLGLMKTGETIEHEGEGFGALLEKMTPLVMAGMNAPQQVQPVQPKPTPNPQQREAQKMNMMGMRLKMGIAQLLKAASKNSDCGTYATMVIDMLPEEIVKSHVIADDSFDKLKSLDPRTQHFEPWFKLLSEHVKAQLGLPSLVDSEYADENDTVIDSEPHHDEQTNV